MSCQLRVLLARTNLQRAKSGQSLLSLRQLAGESKVSLSVLTALNTGRNQRIDYATLDRLLTYFSRYFPITTGDLLRWEPDQRAS
ncbi:MAG TPA: helix-turn-helix transcriptional regulator [Ktedonobacterales bacterium]|nr:helix-turn-helix transcriptional regulator [Ktedonobacterales bacterium]